MNMQSMKKTKYLLTLISNYNENRCVVKMNATFIGATPFPHGRSWKYKQFQALFKEYVDLNDDDVKYILRNHKNITRTPFCRISNNLKICKNFRVDMSSIKNDARIFCLNEENLMYRILVLQEMGAKYINTAMIVSGARLALISVFKAYARIPDDVCVAETMYSNLRERPPDISLLKTLKENMIVYDYRYKCLQHYLQWKFEPFSNDKMMKSVTLSLIYKPLSDIEQSFDILHKHGKLPIETIWKYKCLIKCSASDLRQILAEVQTICNVSFVELLNMKPALHAARYENVKYIKTHLEAHNFAPKHIRAYPEVLLLKRKDFLKGWATLTKEPELRILLKHPNVLRIFSLNENVSARLKYLHYVNIRNITVDILSSPILTFSKSVASGCFRNQAKEVSLTLSPLIGLSSGDMRNLLRKHPCWRSMNLLDVYTTLNFLKTRFNDEDIIRNLQLILYPKDQVQQVLGTLINQNLSMDESCRHTPSQLLALCVYEIEKEFHFTGDGVWRSTLLEK